MFRHILPNAMTASLTFLPFILAGSRHTLTSLDFLGFGLPPGSPSLGELLLQGKNNLSAPWLAFTGFVVIAAHAVAAGVHRRGGARRLRSAQGAGMSEPMPALLEVRDLSVTFGTGDNAVRAVQRRQLRRRARRDAGAGRRIGLGQVGDGAVDPAAPALSDGQPSRPAASASRARSWSARRRASSWRVRGNRVVDDLPGADDLAQPAAHDRAAGRTRCCILHKGLTREAAARSARWSCCEQVGIPEAGERGSTPTRTSSRAASASA